ncbi:MAG: reverse transcriptase domain-containing protein [bacterium]|nr:reverse transcriptase domain-containing protein [bacterium]
MENKRPWIYLTATFPKVFTEKAFLYLVSTKKKDFLEITRDKSLFYKIDPQPKKSGGFRDIHKPYWRLKFLLKKINKKFLSRLNFPNFVHCGPQGRSIATAARGHNKFTHHRSIDVKDFFNSVSKITMSSVLRKIGVNKEIADILIKAAVENNKLPQGFPTSSLLSTLVISHALQGFYFYVDREEVRLSVYADDILISSNDENAIMMAKKYIEEELKKVDLHLNKKEYFARNGEQFTWLGLQIYPWVTIPREKLLALEKVVYEYKMMGIVPVYFKPKKPGNLIEQWEESLKGKAAFARSISYNQLANKVLNKLGYVKARKVISIRG